MKLITDESVRFSGNALIRWKPTPDTTAEAPADRTLLSRHLYLAEAFRKPTSYPRQRNYYGLYFFSQTKKHVWHESLLEANMMMFLDHTQSISAIASQPLEMVYADGGRHVPDLIALHSNNRQVVYDVKPAARISSKVLEQFAKTKAVCDAVGWGYEVLPGLTEQVQANLTWLSYFQHDLFQPDEQAVDTLMSALDSHTLSFDDAAQILRPGSLASGRAELFHLLWKRTVTTDMLHHIDETTLIKRNDYAHA
ncbi:MULTISPECIES: TnsA-like heteromeric transposase endonuclease subunit [unclassified Cryobacterium]|uniref:TnsA-like heteromeric transposase endonuclease subunit n=1 Tax=unclassified Cryobacterium TaxID=2649013 RepID=UPI000CE30B9E|nr:MULTISPECIES: TnsA-like heteromeric transposase endonuclease subunit [unclassified Cryobacterium]